MMSPLAIIETRFLLMIERYRLDSDSLIHNANAYSPDLIQAICIQINNYYPSFTMNPTQPNIHTGFYIDRLGLPHHYHCTTALTYRYGHISQLIQVLCSEALLSHRPIYGHLRH